jgi:hypothetical protein
MGYETAVEYSLNTFLSPPPPVSEAQSWRDGSDFSRNTYYTRVRAAAWAIGSRTPTTPLY